ncbi:MAG TPA: 1,4-dihydroxy-2-naphthoate prenyltransferase, partial [Porphyromonadaceae bacterium]|nr:1,4-dihydroxy-2-naphthoate prenyltransferase [Porphyromonadaceae bacterium]
MDKMILKKTLKDWFIVTRPWSFPVSIVPIVASIAYLYWMGQDAGYTFYWTRALIALLSMIMFHAGGNLISDYMDYKRGVDREGIVCVQTLVSGLFTSREVFLLGLIFLSMATLLGLYLAYVCGLPILILGIIGLCTTSFYSYFKYRALGDLIIFCNFAVLPIIGMSFVFVGEFIPSILTLILPVGLITVAVLHINNTRDILPDAQAGTK